MAQPTVTKFGVFRDQVVMHNVNVMGRIHLHARTCAPADVSPFHISVNSWTDCTEIWYVVRDLGILYKSMMGTVRYAEISVLPNYDQSPRSSSNLTRVPCSPLDIRFPPFASCSRHLVISVPRCLMMAVSRQRDRGGGGGGTETEAIQSLSAPQPAAMNMNNQTSLPPKPTVIARC